uniref:Core-binding (CB) domain-containing protein n=1 Tax=Clytia hemisphaerica TaxID=252671 RepID=A0A7M5VAT9_9CNID|eukprot:TCONS_00037564-protein
MNNLELYNGRSLLKPSRKIVIQTDASKKGWGAFCQNQRTGGRWTLLESGRHINVFELKAIHLALLTYHKMFILRNVHFQTDNMSALAYLVKMGGDKEPGDGLIVQRDMGVSTEPRDHDYSRIPPGDLQLCSRLGIQKFPRFQRMATRQESFSKNLSGSRDPSIRSFCIKGLSPASALRSLETRSNESGSRCIPIELERPRTNICIPTVLSHRENTDKAEVRTGNSNFGDPTLASSIVVQPDFGVVRSKPYSNKPKAVFVSKPSGARTSFGREPNVESSGMESVRKGLLAEGISTRASDFIIKARRDGTRANYESAWGKWVRWCGEKKANPNECDLNLVLDYLASLYEKGYEYRTINCHRSAISAYHGKVDGFDVGKHPKVCSLLTGIFNQRPPKPRYLFVWDVDQVLGYLESLPENETLSDQLLNLKLTALLFLTSSGRCHEICYLDIRYKVKTSNSFKFYFSKVTKSWIQGKPPPVLEFKAFSSMKRMCVVSCLSDYLERTKEWRGDGQKNQLLLSHLNPHNEVKSSTISN